MRTTKEIKRISAILFPIADFLKTKTNLTVPRNKKRQAKVGRAQSPHGTWASDLFGYLFSSGMGGGGGQEIGGDSAATEKQYLTH